MSDFLSPAINERLMEKRMEFSSKLHSIMVKRAIVDNESRKWAESEIMQLFLDTIERAKPEKIEDPDDPSMASGYNIAVMDYELRLKKEIGK